MGRITSFLEGASVKCHVSGVKFQMSDAGFEEGERIGDRGRGGDEGGRDERGRAHDERDKHGFLAEKCDLW
jgi:hypothetical protein